MPFTIQKEEYINRTFRLSKSLVDRMEALCNKKGISLNKLTVQHRICAFQSFRE